MARTQAELAQRIENARPMDPEGRYDMASKVEVKAYFKEKWEQLEYDMARVPGLEARIAELELSVWAKIKRWLKRFFAKGGSALAKSAPPIGTVIKQGEGLRRTLGPSTEQIKAAIERSRPFKPGHQ